MANIRSIFDPNADDQFGQQTPGIDLGGGYGPGVGGGVFTEPAPPDLGGGGGIGSGGPGVDDPSSSGEGNRESPREIFGANLPTTPNGPQAPSPSPVAEQNHTDEETRPPEVNLRSVGTSGAPQGSNTVAPQRPKEPVPVASLAPQPFTPLPQAAGGDQLVTAQSQMDSPVSSPAVSSPDVALRPPMSGGAQAGPQAPPQQPGVYEQVQSSQLRRPLFGAAQGQLGGGYGTSLADQNGPDITNLIKALLGKQ